MEEQNKKQNEETRVPVPRAKAKVRKKTELQKFAEEFISDNVSNVPSYVRREIVIPAIIEAIRKVLITAFDMTFSNAARPKSRDKTRPDYGKEAYRAYYDDRDDYRRQSSNQNKNRYGFDSMGFETKQEAEDVLNDMRDLLFQYRFVRVADMYQLCDRMPKSTDYNYGWKTLPDNVAVKIDSEGIWYIDLPRPIVDPRL